MQTVVLPATWDVPGLILMRTCTGTYFVLENVPIGAASRPQPPSHAEDTLYLVEDASEAEDSAPAPVIPRYREGFANIERPKTAPNGAGDSFASRRQRESVKGPPVSLMGRKPKGGKMSIAGLPISEPILLSPKPRTPSPPISEPAVLSPQPRLAPPSASWRYQRSQSTLSMSSGKGFIDLLDAQSELKPQGFHIRVQAAGARDFGEDVADRNMIENGLGLASSKSQEFYPTSGANASKPGILRSRFGSIREMLGAVPENKPQEAPSPQKETPFINGLAQNPVAAEPRSGPTDDQEARLSRHLSQKERVGRRLSLSSYIPSAPATAAASLAPRPQSMHRSAKSISFSTKKERAEPPPKLQLPTEKPGWGNYSHLLPKGEPVPPPSPSFARDSVVLAKSNYSLSPTTRTADELQHVRPTALLSSDDEDPAADRTPRGFDRGMMESARPLKPVSQRRQSIHVETGFDALDMRMEKEPKRPGTSGAAAPISPPRRFQPLNLISVHFHADNLAGTQQAPARANGWQANYTKTKGLVPTYDNKFRIDEIYGHVPIRTSSMAPASATSTATTTSSASSGSFPRPVSRHTPNTSVDLATISSVDSPSPQPVIGNADDASAYWTKMDDQKRAPRRSVASPTYEVATASFHSTFNIDDYFSSGDEANDEPRHGPRRPRGEDEGSLLFQASGYGGLQLPGLYDEPKSPKVAEQTHNGGHAQRQSRGILTAIGQEAGNTRRDSYAPAYSPELDEYYSGQTKRMTVEFDDHDQTFVYEGDDDYDDEEDETDAPVVYRKDLAPGRKGTTRTSALGTANHEFPEPIAEESDEKVDIRTAVRMRKEVKARKRAEGEAIKREQINNKNRQQRYLPERRMMMGQAV